MENYNIQIEEAEKGWLETPVRSISFDDRGKAVEFCENLSNLMGSKIRLSQGKLEGSQGTYISKSK